MCWLCVCSWILPSPLNFGLHCACTFHCVHASPQSALHVTSTANCQAATAILVLLYTAVPLLCSCVKAPAETYVPTAAAAAAAAAAAGARPL
jgi:hypothetical protein